MGRCRMVPAQGTRCWERKHLVFWQGGLGFRCHLGGKGRRAFFPSKPCGCLAPQRLSQGWEESRLSAFWVSELWGAQHLISPAIQWGLCCCRTVSGPEPSSPPGSLSSGPALGLPPALCLPSAEGMEDFSRGSGLCHLISLLLFTQLPAEGFAREYIPPLFLCGFLGAGLVLSIRSGFLFQKSLL